MTDEAILDLADKAARCVLRGRGTLEDWEDATQVAACEIWKRLTLRQDVGAGYLFVAAKSAICDWLRAWLPHRQLRGGTLLDNMDYGGPEQEHCAIAERLPELAPLLREQGATKVEQDLAYLTLVLQGYSTAGVGLELGLSQRNAYAIRERTIPRLERIARGDVPPSRGESVRAGIAVRRARGEGRYARSAGCSK